MKVLVWEVVLGVIAFAVCLCAYTASADIVLVALEPVGLWQALDNG